MAEKITPMPVVGGGSVDVSAPNDSGLRTLAGSLDVAVRSAAEIGQQAQLNEFHNVQSLLNDATLGPDEAKEIAGNAFFPVNRFAAQNRAGEARVHAARDVIEQDLLSAPDSIEARRRLRVHQQKLMEGENELGVQAGIRQAMADLAPALINDASKKRLELRNIQRRNDESFILRDQLTRDPKGFTGALGGILADQEMDATQEPDVHKTAGQTMLNMLIENPAAAPFIKQAAREALDGGLVEGAENRAQYTGVLKAVETLEKAAAASVSTEKAQKAYRNKLGLDIYDLHLAGEYIPEDMKRAYVSTFSDPLTGEAHLRTLYESARNAPAGVIDTDAYRAGLENIKANQRTNIFIAPTEEDNQIRAATLEIYDSIMGSVDPKQVQGTTDAYQQANQAAELALQKASEFVGAMKGNPEAEAASVKSLKQQMAAARAAGNNEEAIRLYGEVQNFEKTKGLRRRRKLIQSYVDTARSYGISTRDLRQ